MNPSGYNFGTVNLGSNASTTVTFAFTGSVTVGSVSVLTQGATGLDFQPTSPDTSTTLCKAKAYVSGNTCTVDITFAPLSPGQRTGAAVLRNNSNVIVGTAYVTGIGSGAQLGFAGPNVSTFVGTGTYNINASAAGSTGTSAAFVEPEQVAFDGAGNMYMADNYARQIYKITPAGLVSVVLGQFKANCGTNYTCGYPTSNSTMLGTNAQVNSLYAIMVDGAGQLWFNDGSVGNLASVDLATDFVTAQVVGSGTLTSPVPVTSGNIHSCAAQCLGFIASIASDGLGNVYVGDFFDGTQTTAYGQIVKIDAAGNISLVAGTATGYYGSSAPADGATATSSSVSEAYGMGFDGAGNLYYLDEARYTIYKIDTSGKVHPFAGTGASAVQSTTGIPYWLSGTASTTLNTAVNVPAASGFGTQPSFLTVDSAGNVYYPSQNSGTTLVFTPSGYAYVLAGNGSLGNTDGPASSALLAYPISVALNGTGDIYISEYYGAKPNSSPTTYIGSSVRKWSLGATTLNFGTQAKGSTSAGQVVTATNIGNAPLVLTAPGTGATNPAISSGFTLTANSATNACGTGSSGAVAVGSSCSVIAAFQPHVPTGSVTGNLTFSGNISSATVPLSGTAAAGVASLAMTGLPASTTSGTSNTVTVSAYDGGSNLFTGYTGTVSFSLSPTDVSAALPSAYTFTGSEGGTKTFSVALSAPGAHTVTVVDTADSLTASENTTVAPAIDHLAFTAGPPTTATAGVSFNVTVTAYSNSGTTVATNYTGPIKFTSSDSNAVFPTGTALNMTGGVGTYAITLKTAGNQTLSVADSSGGPSTSNSTIAVNAGAASSISAYSGSGQSVIIGNTFTNPLVVQTADAYNNPVGGVTVSFAGPGTGASATFSASSCVTSATATPAGSCSVTATANATAGTNYSVIGSSGSLTSATFTLTNNAKTAQTITFNNPGTQTFGTTPTLTATSTSSLTVAFSSTTTGVCTVTSGGALTFLTSGTCTINADQAGNSTYAAATTVPRSFTVNAVVAGAPTIGTATGGNAQATVSFTAPANTGGTSITSYTVTSSPGGFTGTGSASPITVTGLTNGTAYTFTVTATSSAGTSTASAPSNSVTPAGTQTITFNNPGTQAYGTTPTLTATASSGLAVVFSSTTTGICTVTSGGTLTFVTTGTCTINADQAGNGSYPAAPTVQQSFTVQAASQTITFTQPAAQNFGTTPTLSATSTSGLTVSFTSTTTGVCTITSGGALTFVTTGTCTIAANQAGNANYAAATAVTRSFGVNAVVAGPPTIGTATAGNAQASVSFTAPANTGGAAITSYTATSSLGGATGVGVASPLTVSGLTNGTSYTFTVTATNSAGTSTASAASNSVTPIGTQTITFNNPGTQTYGTTPTLSGSASSGLAVAFTSTSPSVCTITSGGALTFIATGTCAISANQSGNSAYSAATTVPQSFTVQAASQTITFTQPTTPIIYGVSSITLTASGGASGNAVTFSIISGPGTVSGTTLTVTGAGTIVVAADQAGNSNYSAATEVQRSIVVNAASQTITFTQPTSPVTYGVSPILLSATGGASGNAVTFSVISGPGTVSGSTLTVNGAGTIVVAADQVGNTNYGAATEVQRSIVVNAASQTITFTQPSTPITYGSSTTVALSATGGASGNAVTFTVASGPGTISGPTLTITGAGTIVINANQAASANYAAATQVQRSVVVSTAASTLAGPVTQPVFVVFSQSGTVPVTIAGQYSGTGIAAPGTGTTGNTISYSIVNSSSTSVASGSLTIASGAVSVPVASTLAPGIYTVNTSYAGDSNYSAAASITINLQVGQIQPVAAIIAPVSALTYGSALGIAATATYNSSAVAGSFTYTATPTGGTASGVTAATILPAGTYLVTANFTPADAVTYKTATTTAPLTVNKATPGVTLTSTVNPLLVQNATTLTATVSSAVSSPGGSVTFYDNTASAAIGAAVPLTNGVATMSVSTLTVGTHSITAIYSGDTNFVTFTSTAVSEQVDDFSLAISTSASSSTSQTILPGGTATFSFTLSPTGTTAFPAAVNLTVTGLPTGATYTITPSILAAGSGSTPVTLTITAPKQTAMLHTGEKLAPFALALLLLPFGGRMRRRAGKLSKLVALHLLIVGGAASMATLTGCGSTTGFFASPQQTYNVTITGTSGALSHSTTVNLTVE